MTMEVEREKGIRERKTEKNRSGCMQRG